MYIMQKKKGGGAVIRELSKILSITNSLVSNLQNVIKYKSNITYVIQRGEEILVWVDLVRRRTAKYVLSSLWSERRMLTEI